MNYDYAFYEIMDESSLYMDGFMDLYRIEHDIFSAVMEADDSPKVDVKMGKGKGHFLTKIVQAFHRIMQLFMTNAKKLRKKYNGWLVKASKQLDSIDYSKLQVNIDLNYMSAESNLRDITRNQSIRRLTDRGLYTEAGRKRFRSSTPTRDMTNFETFLRTDIFRNMIDSSGSLGEGAKSFFRYGRADIKTQKPKAITGDKLRTVVQQCSNYCLRYDKLTEDLKKVKELAAKTIEEVAQRNQTVSESYIYLEESFIKDTELTLLFPMLEAEMDKKDDHDKSPKPNVETGSNTNSNNSNSQKPNQPKEDVGTEKMKNNVASSSKEELKFIKFSAQALQIILTSALTIAEERYVTYIKILRYAVRDKAKFNSLKDDGGEKIEKK